MVKKKGGTIKLDEKPNKLATSAPQPMPPSQMPITNPKLIVNPRTGAVPEARTPFPAAFGSTTSAPNGSPLEIGEAPENESSAFQTGVKMQTEAVGNSGTQIFGGYFSEEYLNELRGRRGARQWDEMRRSEAQISMLMNAVMNPIKSANWAVEAPDESDAQSVLQAELVKTCIFDMIDFDTFKHEALTVVPFGFSLMEVVHSVEYNHPKFGTYNGLKALAFRSQKTIENWQLENKTGKLLGVNQYTYSDLGGNQFIPGQFLLVFTHAKEGDNYEGISALRPMLGAYKRKELYLKLAAIGIERYAIGTPIGTIPKGKEKGPEVDQFKTVLQNYTSHESSFITKPEGWDIEIQKGDFDASKIKELLTFENTEFANAIVGNFLALGMNGGGGAYALGSNLGEFFTSGIQAYADLICSTINRDLIPNLVKLNFGDQRAYPKMKVTGISDKAGKELAETIKYLADSRSLDPDKPLKDHIRKLYKLPKPDPTTAIALPAIPAGAASNFPKQNDPVIDPQTGKEIPYNVSQLDGDPSNDKTKQLSEIKLADSKYVKAFDKSKADLKCLMKEQLHILYSGLKDALRKKYNSLSGSDKILAAKGLETPGLNSYKAELRQALAEIAAKSIVQARKEVPSKSRVKLYEDFVAVRLAEGAYDALPPNVRKLVDAQSNLIAETQAADIEKQVFFTFTSSATVSDDIDSIMNDVDETVEPSLQGSTAEGMSIDAAAGDAVGHIIQQSSLAFFFDDDVLDGIESFTFTNEDPVSEICQELAGTTFGVGDPDLDRFTPPLHHNCKSRLVPNLKGDSDNPDIDRGGVSVSRKALDSITLAELKSKNRKHIAKSNFAVPSERKFPIHDISHARNALARASGTQYEAQVKAAVYKKWPSLKPEAK